MTIDPIGWFSRWIPERVQYRVVQGCLLAIIGSFLWLKFRVDPERRLVLWWEEVAVFVTFFIVVATRRAPEVRATGWVNLVLPCFSAWLPFIPAGGLDLLMRSLASAGTLPPTLTPYSPRIADHPYGSLLINGLLCGGTAGLWISILSLRRSFSVSVEVRGLVQSGIYRWIRHPMYVSEILSTAGFALIRPSAASIAALVLFTIAIVIRANAEERLLLKHVPEYAEYRTRTWALLPVVIP